MKIKTLFKTIFCAGLVLTLVLYLCHLYGNYIEKTQEPITGYTYNGFKEKSNYWRKRSIPTHSEWLYPLTFDAGKGLKEA